MINPLSILIEHHVLGFLDYSVMDNLTRHGFINADNVYNPDLFKIAQFNIVSEWLVEKLIEENQTIIHLLLPPLLRVNPNDTKYTSIWSRKLAKGNSRIQNDKVAQKIAKKYEHELMGINDYTPITLDVQPEDSDYVRIMKN